MKYILNRQFELISILENESEAGNGYDRDQLSLLLSDGMYSGSFNAEKKVGINLGLEQGNFVTLMNKSGHQILGTIMEAEEDSGSIFIEYQDVGLDLVNGYVDEVEAPINPKNARWYLEQTLQGTGWMVGVNESVSALILEFSSQQSILERIQEIIRAFGGLARYTCEFDGFKVKKFQVNLLKREGVKKAIRFDSDINLDGVRRRLNILDFATRITVRGNEISEGDTGGSDDNDIGTTLPDDTPPEETGWRPDIVDRRTIAMGGQSVDRSLSDITHIAIHYTAVDRLLNRTISNHENYWRTEHGWPVGGYHVYIDSQGVVYRNYNYEKFTYGVFGNNDYTVHVSVEANSAENYSEAQLKSRDWVVRKFMKDLNIPADNVKQHKEYGGNESNSCAGYTTSQMNQIRAALKNSVNYLLEWPDEEETDATSLVELAIAGAYKLIGVPYAWGGNTKSGFDCSGLVNIVYKEAGFTNWVPYRAITNTYWDEDGPFYRINSGDRQRGDLILMDTIPPAPGHVGIYIGDNQMLHTGGPNGVPMGGPVSLNGYRVMGYVRVELP